MFARVLRAIRRPGQRPRRETAWERALADTWSKECLFTFKDFDRQAFLRSELSDRVLADIGLALVARLSALYAAA